MGYVVYAFSITNCGWFCATIFFGRNQSKIFSRWLLSHLFVMFSSNVKRDDDATPSKKTN